MLLLNLNEEDEKLNNEPAKPEHAGMGFACLQQIHGQYAGKGVFHSRINKKNKRKE